jgi:hypothetical protein
MKHFNDTIGNRTRNLPTCSTVPQPTAPPAACPLTLTVEIIKWPAAQSFRLIGSRTGQEDRSLYRVPEYNQEHLVQPVEQLLYRLSYT